MNRFVVLISFLLFFHTVALHAQNKAARYEVGIAVGSFIYQGDLTPNRLGSFPTMRHGISLHGTRKINNNYAVRLLFSAASLRGDDARFNNPAFRQFRNFNFRSPLVEVSPHFMWSPSGWSEQGPRITPYAFGGAAFSYLNIRRDASGFDASKFGLEENLPQRIAEDLQRRTPRLLPSIPVGAGLRYAVSPSLVINGELNYRFTFSDYIDGFSIAANPQQKDKYYSVTIGITYRFGKRKSWDCPPVRN